VEALDLKTVSPLYLRQIKETQRISPPADRGWKADKWKCFAL